MPKRSGKPRDLNSLAASIVEDATDDTPEQAEPEKDPAAVALGRRGGQKGGRARADRMSAEERHVAAQRAALARWRAGGSQS